VLSSVADFFPDFSLDFDFLLGLKFAYLTRQSSRDFETLISLRMLSSYSLEGSLVENVKICDKTPGLMSLTCAVPNYNLLVLPISEIMGKIVSINHKNRFGFLIDRKKIAENLWILFMNKIFYCFYPQALY
jgi:hypothetical protein